MSSTEAPRLRSYAGLARPRQHRADADDVRTTARCRWRCFSCSPPPASRRQGDQGGRRRRVEGHQHVSARTGLERHRGGRDRGLGRWGARVPELTRGLATGPEGRADSGQGPVLQRHGSSSSEAQAPHGHPAAARPGRGTLSRGSTPAGGRPGPAEPGAFTTGSCPSASTRAAGPPMQLQLSLCTPPDQQMRAVSWTSSARHGDRAGVAAVARRGPHCSIRLSPNWCLYCQVAHGTLRGARLRRRHNGGPRGPRQRPATCDRIEGGL